MLKFTSGNLFHSKAEALVNAVNTVGVMGKGLALQFKEKFPQNYQAYREACKNEELVVGKIFTFEENGQWIINFPTKKHWRGKSKYGYIEEGLKSLVTFLEESPIKSIALPPLGCGYGDLTWEKVKEMFENYLTHLENIEIFIYQAK